MSNTKLFECFNTQCGKQLSFNLKVLSINKILTILCPDCNTKWALTIDGSSCCKTYVRFISNEGNRSIVKVKSYSK